MKKCLSLSDNVSNARVNFEFIEHILCKFSAKASRLPGGYQLDLMARRDKGAGKMLSSLLAKTFDYFIFITDNKRLFDGLLSLRDAMRRPVRRMIRAFMKKVFSHRRHYHFNWVSEDLSIDLFTFKLARGLIS